MYLIEMQLRKKAFLALAALWILWNLWIVFGYSPVQTMPTSSYLGSWGLAIATFLILTLIGLAVLGFLYFLGSFLYSRLAERRKIQTSRS